MSSYQAKQFLDKRSVLSHFLVLELPLYRSQTYEYPRQLTWKNQKNMVS